MYGSHPLHLLLMVAGFSLAGYVVVTATPATLVKPEDAWWHSMALWFAAAFLAHDLVLFPVYAGIDRLLEVAVPRTRLRAINYVRVPALGSALLLLIFFPGIVRQGADLYRDDTGLTQDAFLGRWLMLTAVMFAASAGAYGVRILWLATTSRRSRLGDAADQPSAGGNI